MLETICLLSLFLKDNLDKIANLFSENMVNTVLLSPSIECEAGVVCVCVCVFTSLAIHPLANWILFLSL